MKSQKQRPARGKSRSAKPAARRRARTVKTGKPIAAKKPRVAGHWISHNEFDQLKNTLREAQETLDAIHTGAVDAVVVNSPKGNKIYSLAGAEQPYRVYVERMQEGAVTVSSSGLILFCNQKFADMTGLSLERVIGSQLTRYLPAVAWQTVSAVFGAGDEVVKCQAEMVNRDSGNIPVNLSANCLPQPEYQVMCLVVTDLSDQKKHETLRMEKEVAEKASLAKDGFLAALSHELRTPLMPLLMSVMSMEQDTALSAESVESLKLIRRNVELEARLIDDLLDLTRIASGKLELHIRELDFHMLIQRAVEILRPECSAKSQSLVLELKAEHHLSEGDSVRLQQAIWNLIGNAVKFTPEGGTITLRARNSSENIFLFEVEDTGIGFAPEKTENLFTAFAQGGREITRRFGGLGLGLAIARSIVQAHGGQVRAASQGEGRGATFSFEIPIRHSHSISERRTVAASSSADMAPGKRILLVEDHEDTRTSLEKMLRKNKYEVSSANSAEAALLLAETNQFDVVISDVGLPGQSGLELMGQLKYKFNLRGIGLSGFGMEEDIARGHAAGFSHYLTKPVSFDELKEVIEFVG